MRVRSLGWAGVEVEAEGAGVVIDPLADPGATFAALGEGAERTELPVVAPARAAGTAVAGLVSHLHRDHTDAGALSAALAEDAAVHEPEWPGGEDLENLALAQADYELEQSGLRRRAVAIWEGVDAGPFRLTALPAVDGLGEPQISWLVEADGKRVLHLGDTMFHGYWWRMARRHGPFDVVFTPINAPLVDFPHLQPPSGRPAALDPDQAATVGTLLNARILVPMHYAGFAVEPWYRPVDSAEERFLAATEPHAYETRILGPGDAFEI